VGGGGIRASEIAATRPMILPSEPHIEDGTYNLYSLCNQHVLRNAITAGERYLFFLTKHRGRMVVSGYYTIDEVARLSGRFAVRTRHPYFVDQPLSVDDVWPKLFQRTAHQNRMYMKRKLGPAETDKLLRMLHQKPNRFRAFVREVERLRSRKARTRT